MPLGYHADCRSTGKWVKDGICSACGQRVVLHRREPEDSDFTSETLDEDWPAQRDTWVPREFAGHREASRFR